MKKYEIDERDLLSLLDLARIATNHAVVKTCAGGRYISDGYMCAHCGRDPTTLYDEKGEEIVRRAPGQRVFRRCGESPKKAMEANLADQVTDCFPPEE